MADVSLPLARSRIETARSQVCERFLNPGRAVAVGAFLAFALTFDTVNVQDDGLVYFNFVRKLFGVDDAPAVAYQFGSSFWTAPFYLVSRLVAVRGAFGSYHTAEVATAVAANAATVLTLYFGWRILRELDLPRGPVVLLLTLFGTPLFYSAAMSPSGKHAADTLYATAFFWFVLRSTRADARVRDFLGAGVCLGLMLVTRFANVALGAGVLAVLLVVRLRRPTLWIAVGGAAMTALLLLLPVLRHIPYAAPPGNVGALPAATDGPLGASVESHLALGPGTVVDPVLRGTQFDATAPVKMLFTLHRGLFIWTPVTLFATIGLVLLLRRDRRDRVFLAALAVSGVALVAIHALWGKQWDGGSSFSARFLTALFPVFLVGTAEFVRRFRAAGAALLALCAAWSVWIALVQYNGYYHQSSHDSVVQIVENYSGPYRQPPPHDSIGNFGHEIWQRVSGRWQLYWGLVSVS